MVDSLGCGWRYAIAAPRLERAVPPTHPQPSVEPYPVLSIRRLRRPGLEPVDLDVAAGECVAVHGPSGAGKTLLLRAIADLDPCDGAVELEGRSRESMAAHAWRRRVVYLPPESGWWADGVKAHFADPEAARRLLPRLHLPADALAWPVSRLSTGERQRMALARVLVGTPAVLLLDEPTSGLDRDSMDGVEAVLRERLAAGVAVVLVSHDRDQIGRLAGRVLAMAGGRLDTAGEAAT